MACAIGHYHLIERPISTKILEALAHAMTHVTRLGNRT